MAPNRRSQKSPGAQPLTSQRDQYRALMREGISNAAASRIVGVNRKTGHRWRYGRSVTTRTGEVRTYPAITRPADPVSTRYLSEAERISIADGLTEGLGIRAIAIELGRAPSTVSREIRRNADAGTSAYHPFRAQRRAAGRRVRPRSGKLVRNHELRAVVADQLEGRWSPEQAEMSVGGSRRPAPVRAGRGRVALAGFGDPCDDSGCLRPARARVRDGP